MSVSDVHRAFMRGLEGKGSCKMANIECEDGGYTQRLIFHVVSPSHGAAYLSEAIPADMCPMQHARKMAMDFLEGRVSGQSKMVMAPVPAPAIEPQQPPAPPVTAVTVQAPQPPPVVQQPVAANDVERMTEMVNQGADPIAHPVPEEMLDQAIATGDLETVIDVICSIIDEEAGTVRSAWTTSTPGQGLEYEQVRREINDLAYGLVDASPENAPCLWASVGVDVPKTGNDEVDLRTAAALINQCIDKTSDFLARVRHVRLKSKSAIRQATSIEQALELYAATNWPVE